MTTIDPTTSAQIVFAAMRMAGEASSYDSAEQWQGAVSYHVGQIAHLMSEDTIARIPQVVLGARDKSDETSKCFTGTLVGLKREETSNRVVLKLRTRTSDRNPEGIDYVRTEPLWSPAGADIAQRLKGVKGHRLLIYVDMQRMKDGNRVRVLSAFVDLGTENTTEEE